jgi:hypothetical protein
VSWARGCGLKTKRRVASGGRVADFSLPQTKKNEILGMILEVGLDRADFEWRQVASSVAHGHAFSVEALVHRPTGYFFEFGVDNKGSLWAFFQPGRDGSRKSEHAGSWGYVSSYARQWIERVGEEHNAPDLWAAVADQRELITETDVENTPFTSAEQGRIAEQLTEVMEYLRATSDLEAERLDRIEKELVYLKDASQRLPRLDWRNVLLGSF